MTAQNHTREILTGTSAAFVLRLFVAALHFAMTVALTRLLGASGAGVFFLGLSVVMVGSVVSRLGFDDVVVKLVAGARTTEDWSTVNAVVHFTMWVSLVLSAISAVVLSLFSASIANGFLDSPSLTQYLPLFSLGIGSFAAMFLISEALRGLKKIASSIFVVGAIYPLIMLALMYPTEHMFGLSGLVVSFVIGTSAATVFGYWSLRRSVPTVERSKIDRAGILKSGLSLWFMMLVNRAIIPWTPIIFLGAFATSAEVGIYAAATRVVVLVSFVLVALNTVLAPKFSELHHSGRENEIRPLAVRVTIYLFVATIPIFLLVFFESGMIMRIFGQQFSTDGATILSVLAIGQFSFIFGGAPSQILMMTGKERVLGRLSVVIGALLIIAMWILIPKYGALGAAISNMISLWLLNGISFVIGMARSSKNSIP